METHAGEHPRIGAVDVVPFVPLARHADGRVCRDGARLRAADRGPLGPARLPVRAGRDTRRPRQAGRRPPRPVRGAEGRDHAQRPPARLRPRADAPAGRGGRRRCPAVPHRVEHQPRLRRRRAREADRPTGARVGRRPAARPGERVPGRGARSRAPGAGTGLDEPARLPDHADVARLGGGRRARRRGRRRAGRVGADRPRPARRVHRHRRPRRRPRPTRRWRRGSTPRPPRSGCATRRRSWPSSSGSPLRGTPSAARRDPPPDRGRARQHRCTRAPDPRCLPGRDARRRPAARRRTGRRRRARRGARRWPRVGGCAGRRLLGGPDRGRRPARGGGAGSRGRRLRPVPLRPPRCRWRRRHARAWSIPTRTCCSRAPASRSSCCASRARATSRSSPRAAGSCRRSR